MSPHRTTSARLAPVRRFFSALRRWLCAPRVATVAFLLVTAASWWVDVRPGAIKAERFIGHADEANMAEVARNIAEGRGAVARHRWILRDGGLPGDEVTHPEAYWSIYCSAFVAFFFKVFGAHRAALLFAVSVAKSLAAVLAFGFILASTRRAWAAFAGGCFLLFHATTARWVFGKNDVFLSAAVMITIALLIQAVQQRRWWWWGLAGLMTGLAIGVKPSGLVLLGLVPFLWLVVPERWSRLRHSLWALPLGVAIGVAPLAKHNHDGYGSVITPAYTGLVAEAALVREMKKDHDLAFYDPEPLKITEAQRKKHAGTNRQLKNAAAWFRKTVEHKQPWAPHWLWPFLLVGLWWTARAAWRSARWRVSTEGLFAMISVAMAIAGVAVALRVHVEDRYMHFALAVLSTAAFIVMTRMSRVLLVFVLVVTAWSGYEYQKTRRIRPAPRAYTVIDKKVPKDAVLLTSNPWEVTFHTRRESVALPYNRKVQWLKHVADRFGAEYVVVVNKDARHKVYDRVEKGQFPSFMEKIHYEPDIAIAKLPFGKRPRTPAR